MSQTAHKVQPLLNLLDEVLPPQDREALVAQMRALAKKPEKKIWPVPVLVGPKACGKTIIAAIMASLCGVLRDHTHMTFVGGDQSFISRRTYLSQKFVEIEVGDCYTVPEWVLTDKVPLLAEEHPNNTQTAITARRFEDTYNLNTRRVVVYALNLPDPLVLRKLHTWLCCGGGYTKVKEWLTTPVSTPPLWDSFRDHLERQRKWSEKTFGPGPRPEGLVDHIRKECDEILAEPGDLEEWVDVVILALDGAWRSGHTSDQITEALQAKQNKNMKRKWPDWRTAAKGKAIEHVEAPAPIPAAVKRPLRRVYIFASHFIDAKKYARAAGLAPTEWRPVTNTNALRGAHRLLYVELPCAQELKKYKEIKAEIEVREFRHVCQGCFERPAERDRECVECSH